MSEKPVYYITTSIPYVNAKPHVGHALEFVQTDAYARFHRLLGEDIYFLSGSDENSLTNVLAAEAEGISTRELVDRNVVFFQRAMELLDCSNDDFIRTSAEERHFAGSAKLWQAIDAAGDVYTQRYSGLYCVRCELFYTEEELVDGLCPDHHIPPVHVEEENYFFRLSKYQDELHRRISNDEMQVIPETRKNEVLRFIEQGLEDFSISRSQERAHGWGVPVPGDESQVMYVWVDALSNYLTALDFATDGDLYERYWLNADHRVHEIGKNIVRFHAIYWPAMLLSAGVPLPTEIVIHGFLTIDGEKMSKSLGNVIDPIEVVEEFGADATRYYLLREVSPGRDGDFSIRRLIERYNSDLANDLGNLVNRSVSMINRYRDGEIPEAGEPGDLEQGLAATLAIAEERSLDLWHNYEPQQALNAIWEAVTATNTYIEQSAPWVLARSARDGDEAAAKQLNTVLATLPATIGRIAWHLQPVIPASAAEIGRQLGFTELGVVPATGQRVTDPSPIFPRIEVEETEAAT